MNSLKRNQRSEKINHLSEILSSQCPILRHRDLSDKFVKNSLVCYHRFLHSSAVLIKLWYAEDQSSITLVQVVPCTFSDDISENSGAVDIEIDEFTPIYPFAPVGCSNIWQNESTAFLRNCATFPSVSVPNSSSMSPRDFGVSTCIDNNLWIGSFCCSHVKMTVHLMTHLLAVACLMTPLRFVPFVMLLTTPMTKTPITTADLLG
jgi:hypothetical protein